MPRRTSTRRSPSPRSCGSPSSVSRSTAPWAWWPAGGRPGPRPAPDVSLTFMQRRTVMNRVLAVLLVTVLLAIAAPGSAQAPARVVFALNWIAVGDHAAYWVALEKGYYKARGLDVELQNSKGSGDSLAKVDTNRADEIGRASCRERV